jgi:hypothetical protein
MPFLHHAQGDTTDMEAQNDKMLDCRGVLVGVEDGSTTHAQVMAELAELSRLLDTAGGVTVAQVIQNKSTPDPRTWIGSGKVKEIAELCDVGISTAVVRFKRLCQVRHNSSARRKEKNYGTFMLSSKETAVCDNFKDFIAAERERRGKNQTKTSDLNDSSKEESAQKSDVIIE